MQNSVPRLVAVLACLALSTVARHGSADPSALTIDATAWRIAASQSGPVSYDSVATEVVYVTWMPDFVGIGLMSDGDQTHTESSADFGTFTVTR